MNGIRFGNTPPVVKNLIIINALLLLGTWALSGMGIDLTQLLGLFYFESEYFEPYQFITHMFMHGGLAHLFFNMFALWMFGRILEQVWGSKRFFIFYMVTGLGAAFLHTLVTWWQMSNVVEAAEAVMNTPSPEEFKAFVNEYFPEYYNQINHKLLRSWFDEPDSQFYSKQAVQFTRELLDIKMNIPTVGASGAVFGVLLAFGMLFPNTQLMLLFPPIPIKAKYFVIIYGLLELYLGFANHAGDNVAHFAHLGGMIFGYFMIKYWGKGKNNFY